jgi:hypothetical protein
MQRYGFDLKKKNISAAFLFLSYTTLFCRFFDATMDKIEAK